MLGHLRLVHKWLRSFVVIKVGKISNFIIIIMHQIANFMIAKVVGNTPNFIIIIIRVGQITYFVSHDWVRLRNFLLLQTFILIRKILIGRHTLRLVIIIIDNFLLRVRHRFVGGRIIKLCPVLQKHLLLLRRWQQVVGHVAVVAGLASVAIILSSSAIVI